MNFRSPSRCGLQQMATPYTPIETHIRADLLLRNLIKHPLRFHESILPLLDCNAWVKLSDSFSAELRIA